MTTITNGESGLSFRNKLNAIWAGLELNQIDTSIAATAIREFSDIVHVITNSLKITIDQIKTQQHPRMNPPH